MQTAENFLTVEQAAELAGLSHWTIRRWLDTAKPKLTRYKSASRTVVSRAELLELVRPRVAHERHSEVRAVPRA